MADEQDLIIATFDTLSRAHEVKKTLQQLDRRPGAIDVGNIAVVEKDAKGNINLHETEDHKALLGEIAGTVAGAVAWVAYSLSGAGNASAAGSMAYEDTDNAIEGRTRDVGFSDEELYELGERLDAGHSALVLLASAKDTPEVTSELQELGGTVISQPITPEMLAEIMGGS